MSSDNTVNHGPRGNDEYGDALDADPCFAKVIDGFAAVDRLQQTAVAEGGQSRIQHFVAIEEIRLLPKQNK